MHYLLTIWLTTCAADATTTHLALTRGAREVVLTQSPALNDALIGGEALVGAFGARHLSIDHPRVARWVLVGSIVARGLVVAHNVRVLQRIKS